MANLNIHPAPGLGDLTAGFFVVPQNPLQMAQEGISRVRSLGELVYGSFVVPQNPLYAYSTGQVQPIGQGSAGMPLMKHKHGGMTGLGCGDSCGCGGGGSCGCGGMGALDFSSTANFMTSLTSLATEDSLGLGVPNWAYAAGLLGVYLVLFSGSTGPSRVARGRRAYRAYAA